MVRVVVSWLVVRHAVWEMVGACIWIIAATGDDDSSTWRLNHQTRKTILGSCWEMARWWWFKCRQASFLKENLLIMMWLRLLQWVLVDCFWMILSYLKAVQETNNLHAATVASDEVKHDSDDGALPVASSSYFVRLLRNQQLKTARPSWLLILNAILNALCAAALCHLSFYHFIIASLVRYPRPLICTRILRLRPFVVFAFPGLAFWFFNKIICMRLSASSLSPQHSWSHGSPTTNSV